MTAVYRKEVLAHRQAEARCLLSGSGRIRGECSLGREERRQRQRPVVARQPFASVLDFAAQRLFGCGDADFNLLAVAIGKSVPGIAEQVLQHGSQHAAIHADCRVGVAQVALQVVAAALDFGQFVEVFTNDRCQGYERRITGGLCRKILQRGQKPSRTLTTVQYLVEPTGHLGGEIGAV
jgi:hypothetical protein